MTDAARLAVIGGGPAGLMAAEVAIAAGLQVDLYEAKGSVGRKFLLAGKGGLNLTHSEPFETFVARYGARRREVETWLREFDADALRGWARDLGVETFVGTSGRVFPRDLRAAPLLRGWVRRLRQQGVRFHTHRRWVGWAPSATNPLCRPRLIDDAGNEYELTADAVVLAVGGASWPELGSDGSWVPSLEERGVDVAPLLPSNCGFDVDWSEHFAQRHAGEPIKPVIAHWTDMHGQPRQRQGEFVATASGIEGSLIYALSADLRESIARDGFASIRLDLTPGRDLTRLERDLARPRGDKSIASHLRRCAAIDGVKSGLLREVLNKEQMHDMAQLAATLKALPLRLRRARPIAEAISSAGGVSFAALDPQLMLKSLPGVFCAGEMIDWEAPTGGYLLTASFASGRIAGLGAVNWLQQPRAPGFASAGVDSPPEK
ncbi:MAG: TIGR03862 family flavoprotein [Tahibacter sp.]